MSLWLDKQQTDSKRKMAKRHERLDIYLSLYRMIGGDKTKKNDRARRYQRLQRVRIVRSLQTEQQQLRNETYRVVI